MARSLADNGLLAGLVTDLYWPADRRWAQRIEGAGPKKVAAALRRRYAETLPASSVEQCLGSGIAAQAISALPHVPFAWTRAAVRWCDHSLGRRAGQLATEKNAAILAYSYYAQSAFAHYSGDQPRILFQLHPHPASVRAILTRERELNPDCATSLDKEWEIALPEEDFVRLVEEPLTADYCLAASQFTKRTLVEAGIPARKISVIPYGIDIDRFSARKPSRPSGSPLRLLFVGTICQRKGIKYLLEALELLPQGKVELTICGRQVDDLALLRGKMTPIKVYPSISNEGLIAAYRDADVFVFPSLAEGFAQVLLEAMASGLPIIATDRTAAPDLIQEGVEGFIAKAGSAQDLAVQIEKFLQDPRKVVSMGEAARKRAHQLSWKRFRDQVAEVCTNVLQGVQESAETAACSRF